MSFACSKRLGSTGDLGMYVVGKNTPNAPHVSVAPVSAERGQAGLTDSAYARMF